MQRYITKCINIFVEEALFYSIIETKMKTIERRTRNKKLYTGKVSNFYLFFVFACFLFFNYEKNDFACYSEYKIKSKLQKKNIEI